MIDRFPKLTVAPYNLSCYSCCLGRQEECKEWFRKALALGDRKEILKMAKEDQDLRTMRDWLETL